jgi:iron complex outermembrane receptor protein
MKVSSTYRAGALCAAASTLALSVGASLFPNLALAEDAPSSGRAPANASLLGEVVVTAQKREENLQAVPMAITAYTAEVRDKTGLTSAQDQLNFTPGVTFQPPSSSDADRVTIRGIGRVTTQIGTDGGVAIYQDGFYTGSSTGLGGSTLGTDRVEILRGPQGTLYGRNSIGGAVNVISRMPDHKFTADLRVTGNDYGGETVEGRFAGPITDHIRASAWLTQNDQSRGYYHDVLPRPAPGAAPGDPLNTAGSPVNQSLVKDKPQEGGTGHGWTGDFQVAFDAGSNFDGWARFAVTDQYSYPRDSTGINNWGSNVHLIVPNVFTGFDPAQNPGIKDHRAFYTSQPTKYHLSNDYQFITHLNWHAPGFDVKYIGGYWQYTGHLDEDGDATANHDFSTPGLLPGPPPFFTPGTQTARNDIHYIFHDTHQAWSHEINISSTNNSPLQWLIGAYYYNEAHDQTFNVPDVGESHYNVLTDYLFYGNPIVTSIFGSLVPSAPSGPINNPKDVLYYYDANLKTQSEALFAQLDWKPNDQLHFTLGARYSWDQKVGNEYNYYITQIPLVDQPVAAYYDFLLQTYYGSSWPKYPGTNKYVEDFVFEGCQGPGFDGVVSANPSVAPCPGKRTLRNSWSAPTGTAGVEWTPNADTHIYGRYSRGYKSGGYNLGTLAPGAVVKEENIDSFEVGWKQNFGHTFQLNAAAFYYLYHGIQALNLTVVQIEPPLDVNELVNVQESRAYGVELEAKWAPIDNLLLLFNYSYLNTEITSDCSVTTHVGCYIDSSDPLAVQPGANPKGPALVDPVTHDIISQPQSLKGNSLPESPAHKISANISYTWKFPAGNFTLSATEDWHSGFYYALFDNPNWWVKDGAQTDLRAAWTASDKRYEIIARASNLFNAEIPVSLNTLPPTNAGYQILGLQPPRVVTLELRFHY